jgi:hypothetical protein
MFLTHDFYPGAGVSAGHRISEELQVQARAKPAFRAAAGHQSSISPCSSHMTFYPGAGVAAGHRISDGLQVQVGAKPAD